MSGLESNIDRKYFKKNLQIGEKGKTTTYSKPPNIIDGT